MGATLWIVWAIIGVIGGYMAGKLLHTAHSVVLDVCVGVCGALLGGWLLVVFFGNNENMQVFSLVTSAVACAILLWTLSLILPGKPDDDDDD